MAYEVGTAYLSVLPSTTGFAAALGTQLDGPFAAAGTRGGAVMGRNVQTGGRAPIFASGKALAGLFVAGFAAVGAGQIVEAVTGWVSEAILAAADLEQSVGGVDAVFKDQAATIHDWARTASDALGLSRNEYNELATVLGAQLKNAGIPLDEVAAKTGSLVELGADLAAQFGGSTADAVRALSSLLRGERDPIERYGVSINEARVQAYLAEQGLGDLSAEAEIAAKQQATLALLFEQTADAQGAFARESETLTGQQQRFNAEMENLKTEIGMALLPVVSELFALFRDTGLPILRLFTDLLIENPEVVRAFALGILLGLLAAADGFLAFFQAVDSFATFFLNAIRSMGDFFLSFVGLLVEGSARAFGWIPGVGDQLRLAQEQFAEFRDRVSAGFDVMTTAHDVWRGSIDLGRNAIHLLQESIQRLDGSTATASVRIEGGGSAWEFIQRAPGLTPRVVQSLISAPRRAGGGPVEAGRPYVVGEREPELFVPDRSGVVYNQAQLAAAVSTTGPALPTEVTLLDADGSILARTRVVAGDVVDARDRAVAGARATPGRVY